MRCARRWRAGCWPAACGAANGSRSCRPTARNTSPASSGRCAPGWCRCRSTSNCRRRRWTSSCATATATGAVRRARVGAVPARPAAPGVRRRFCRAARSGAVRRGDAGAARAGDVPLYVRIHRASQRRGPVAPEPSLGDRHAPAGTPHGPIWGGRSSRAGSGAAVSHERAGGVSGGAGAGRHDRSAAGFFPRPATSTRSPRTA